MAISSPIKPYTFLIPARLKELKAITVITKKIYEEKRDRYKLEKRLYSLETRSLEKSQLLEREASQETKKPSAKKSIGKFIYKQGVGIGSFLFDLLQFFIGYKIVEWVSKPENSKKVLGIVKGLKGIFDFLNWFVTGTIDNAFSGLHSVIFGETLLERFLGFFRLVIGLLGFRYLLKPGKLFKDLGFVIKNSGKILEVFNTFRKAGIQESAKALLQTLPKTAQLFKHGLTRGLTRGLIKVFGKGGIRILSKFLGPAFAALKNVVLGPIKAFAKTTVKGIPIVGPLLDLGINLALGDPIDKAIVKAAGSALGMGLGALVGSALPGPGTIVGGALGGLVGDWAADKLYGWVKGLFSKKKDDTPKLAIGGIVTQPTKAIIGEAGPEAVIPLPQLFSGAILSAPLGILGSSIIGGVNAVLFSMGSVGNILRPFAQQLFAPFSKEFGVKRFTFATNLGNTKTSSTILNAKVGGTDNKELERIVGKDKQLNLISSTSPTKKSRYNTGNSIREILADIFNNIMNLDFSSSTSNGAGGVPGDRGAGAGGMLPGDAPPEVKAMLEAISAGEGSWDSVNPGTTVPGLSNMTIAQARAAAIAKGWPMGGSGAMGKWQQMPEINGVNTIKQRAEAAGLNYNKDKFNAENQTKIARMLMASVYPGGEAQLVKDAQANPLTAASKLRGTWPSLPGGSQQNTNSKQFLARFGDNVTKYKKLQVGGVVQTAGHPDTGPGYTIQGANDASGRPVVFSQAAASAFSKMMKDSGGVVKASDVASSKRSPSKNAAVGGASKSKHMYGIAMDIHGSSEKWIRKNGSKYGWIVNDYPGSHGGHFEFGGQGIKPSDVSQQNQENATKDQGTPEASWSEILTDLNNLYKGLTGKPKTDGAALQRSSMDMVQSQNVINTAFKSDTYIIAPPTTIASSVNVVTPTPQINYSMNTSFAAFDSSSNYLQSRL